MFCPFQQIGGKLYNLGEAGEVLDDAVLEDSIEDIIVTQLQDYGYFQSDNEDTNNEEVDETEEELKSMEGKELCSDDTESSVADDACSATEKLRKHKDYKNGKNQSIGYVLTELLWSIAAKCQQKQGEEINSSRAKLSKVHLDIGDIGSIVVEGNTKAATSHSWLPQFWLPK